MHFLDQVRNLLCHDAQYMQLLQLDNTVFAVQCQYCQNMPVADVYKLVETLACDNQQDEACTLAERYSEWTGDDSIPVPWVIEGIDGILMKRVMGQSLRVIRKCVQVLKAMNAPFTENGSLERNNEDFQYLFEHFEEFVRTSLKQTQHSKDTLHVVLEGMLSQIHDITSQKGHVDPNYYYDALVPFVKSCREAPLLPPETDHEAPLTRQLVNQLKRSQAVRQLYGPFSMQFNVHHNTVAFIACSTDFEVMANLILDFGARVCRGEFFWAYFAAPPPYMQKALQFFKTDVTYKRNTDMYYVVRHIKNGEGIESLSENLDKYHQMGNLLMDRLKSPPAVRDIEWSSAYPAVLFDSHIPYMSFTFALGYVLGNVDKNTGIVKKGSFAKARRLYREAEDFIRKIYEFDQKAPIIWTMDTFKLFLMSDSHMEERMKNFLNIFVKKDEDEEEMACASEESPQEQVIHKLLEMTQEGTSMEMIQEETSVEMNEDR